MRRGDDFRPLLALVRCPDCRGTSSHRDSVDGLRCQTCGRAYRAPGGGYLDLRPADEFAEQTKYLDEALHADARHERVSPPLLGSKIRNDMLRGFFGPRPDDLVVDLGCGSGRALLWNRDWGAEAVGIDISPYFSEDARRGVDLLLGDLRRLPFADGTFTKACSLDVLEHLSPEALHGMLAEAARVLAPGGALFVYTHVRKNAPIAAGLRWINRFARGLERVGLIDMRQERLRKSDHLNPLADMPDLERVAAAGIPHRPHPLLHADRRRLRREHPDARRRARDGEAGGTPHASPASARPMPTPSIREARTAAKARIASSPTTYGVLRGLSFAMKLDLLLFGRITSGPFFALLEKDEGSAHKARGSGKSAVEVSSV